MRSPDQERFGQLVAEFVDSCGFAKPFHVTIDPRDSVSVVRYDLDGIEEVCATHSARARKLNVMPPLVVTVVSEDGHAKAAIIEVERRRQ